MQLWAYIHIRKILFNNSNLFFINASKTEEQHAARNLLKKSCFQ